SSAARCGRHRRDAGCPTGKKCPGPREYPARIALRIVGASLGSPGDRAPRAGAVPCLVAKATIFLSLGAAEHIDIGEHARRRRVPAMDHLIRLALAAVLRAVHLERGGVAHRAQAAPERRRYATVVWILYHAGAPALLDEFAPRAAELELVTRIVDRSRQVRAHQHAARDRSDHRFERARPRLDVEVRHAVDR